MYPTQVYDPYARGTFDNIWWAMLSVFQVGTEAGGAVSVLPTQPRVSPSPSSQIMTLQNWTDQLIPAYLAQGWLGVFFVAVVVVLGGFVLVR